MLIIKNMPLLKTNKYTQFFAIEASSTTGLNTISIELQRKEIPYRSQLEMQL